MLDRLTAEFAGARQRLDPLEVTHQTLLELTGTADLPPRPAGPPLPPAHQDILGVLTDHPDGIRAKDIALALNLPATSKNTIEGVRAKLKRLVGRDLAAEVSVARCRGRASPQAIAVRRQPSTPRGRARRRRRRRTGTRQQACGISRHVRKGLSRPSALPAGGQQQVLPVHDGRGGPAVVAAG